MLCPMGTKFYQVICSPFRLQLKHEYWYRKIEPNKKDLMSQLKEALNIS